MAFSLLTVTFCLVRMDSRVYLALLSGTWGIILQ